MAIAFTAVLYTVTFTEAGLPAGTSWTVTFDGVPGPLPGTTIAFHAANGSYAYKIANVSGYSLVPWSGSQLVSGPGAGVTVAFTANSSSSVPGGTDLFWALLAAVIVLAVLVVVLALRGRKKPDDAPAAWSPPAGAAAPAPSPAGTAGAPPPGAIAPPRRNGRKASLLRPGHGEVHSLPFVSQRAGAKHEGTHTQVAVGAVPDPGSGGPPAP